MASTLSTTQCSVSIPPARCTHARTQVELRGKPRRALARWRAARRGAERVGEGRWRGCRAGGLRLRGAGAAGGPTGSTGSALRRSRTLLRVSANLLVLLIVDGFHLDVPLGADAGVVVVSRAAETVATVLDERPQGGLAATKVNHCAAGVDGAGDAVTVFDWLAASKAIAPLRSGVGGGSGGVGSRGGADPEWQRLPAKRTVPSGQPSQAVGARDLRPLATRQRDGAMKLHAVANVACPRRLTRRTLRHGRLHIRSAQHAMDRGRAFGSRPLALFDFLQEADGLTHLAPFKRLRLHHRFGLHARGRVLLRNEETRSIHLDLARSGLDLS